MSKISSCPNCGNGNLFESVEVSAGGGYAPNYLPGLGGFLLSAKFVLITCEDCGLTGFFTRPEDRSKLSTSSKWKKI
jgi:predicted nucleic-acid-binding Zn-ribbon protein